MQEDEPQVLLVSVSPEDVAELRSEGIANPVRVLRGPAIEAAIAVGVDGAAVVTLLQTPDTVRKFAEWVVRRFERSGESFELKYRQNGKTIIIRIKGGVSPEAVVRLVEDAFKAEADDSPA